MSLKNRLMDDMKTAMRAHDKPRLGTIRLINAAIKQREVDEIITLDDEQVLVVLEKMLKQRRDSVQQYSAAGRQDLADAERAEMRIIDAYLPAKLDAAETDALLDTVMQEAGATSMRDMGRVMALLKERAAGRVDIASLSAKVKARLA